MGENASLPAINEIAHFLEQQSPTTAEAIGRKGPEYLELLKPGVIGGEDEAPESDKERGLRIRAEILSQSLSVLVVRSDEQVSLIGKKLDALKKLRFFSALCSAVTAGGAAAFAFFVDKQTATIILSLLSLCSNGASIASSSLILGTGRKEGDLVDSLRALARSKSYAELTGKQLVALVDGKFSAADVTALLKDANVQFRELSDALAKSIY